MSLSENLQFTILMNGLRRDFATIAGGEPELHALGKAAGYKILALSYPIAELYRAQQIEAMLRDQNIKIIEPATASADGQRATLLFSANSEPEPHDPAAEHTAALVLVANSWQQKVGGQLAPHLTTVGQLPDGSLVLACGYGGNDEDPEIERLIAIEQAAKENGFTIQKPAAVLPGGKASLLVYVLPPANISL